MHHVLREILEEKEQEVRLLRKKEISLLERERPFPVRDFRTAISMEGRICVVAEIKFASPSAGRICGDLDPLKVARAYQAAGASAVSLLTDKKFFQGDPELLPIIKREITLPVLRKDFIIDEVQVVESFLLGADAILLIAGILPVPRLKDLMGRAGELGMHVLAEVHDVDDMEKALNCGAEIIGINNRNLDTFEVDLATTRRLAPLVPKGCVLVSESGMRCREDIQALRETGVRAVLVGTSIMNSGDVFEKTRELVAAGGSSYGEGEDLRHYDR